jgi:hypothetical protein
MKKQLFLLLYLLGILIAESQTFNDGLFEYTIIGSTHVSVKKYNNNCPTGSLSIPNTIMHNGIVYTITAIENNAFSSCYDLTGDLTIPSSVTIIGDYAFYNCHGLTGNLTLPNSIVSIGNFAFSGCNGFTGNLALPNSVTSIGNYAFFTCLGLTDSLTLPNSVTSIGEYAFYDCNFTGNLTIPNSVTYIGDFAFARLFGLTGVTVYWTTPLVVPTNIFFSINISAIPLTVPAGTIALYQAANVWQDFAPITVLSTEDFHENNISVKLYPNPVRKLLNITLSGDLLLQKILIYNNLGQLMIESKKLIIDVSKLKGIHFIQINTDKGTAIKKIFVK